MNNSAPRFKNRFWLVTGLWAVMLLSCVGLYPAFLFYPVGLFMLPTYFVEYEPPQTVFTICLISTWALYVYLTVRALRAKNRSRFYTTLTILALLLMANTAGCLNVQHQLSNF